MSNKLTGKAIDFTPLHGYFEQDLGSFSEIREAYKVARTIINAPITGQIIFFGTAGEIDNNKNFEKLWKHTEK